MILGRYEHPASACLDELDYAVRQMTDRLVVFNAHFYEAPKGAIIFNTEDVQCATQDGSFVVEDPKALWEGHEVWDTFASTAAKCGAKHVPVGYHRSMERFKPAAEQDIDVVLYGVLNQRRRDVIEGLSARGLKAVHLPRSYGRRRDAILARSKLVLQMQYNPHGEWNTLRTAHCVSNRTPILSESHPTAWDFIPSCRYESLIDEAERIARAPVAERRDIADFALANFKSMPMELPS